MTSAGERPWRPSHETKSFILTSCFTGVRYGAGVTCPSHCDSHFAFWREVIGKAGHVAAITTNYDILVERGLRHKRMVRVFGPGCYYGGIPKPQLLRGTSTAMGVNYIEMEGASRRDNYRMLMVAPSALATLDRM
jgi:hypothetical protein